MKARINFNLSPSFKNDILLFASSFNKELAFTSVGDSTSYISLKNKSFALTFLLTTFSGPEA